MNDFLSQLRQLKKMGGMGGLMGMLPGIGKLKSQIEAAGLDDRHFNRQEAIILSMTKRERIQVALLNASRRKRLLPVPAQRFRKSTNWSSSIGIWRR